MKCLRCQTENPDGARFCEDCGARLPITCAMCGGPVGPGGFLYRSCGASLSVQPTLFAAIESRTPGSSTGSMKRRGVPVRGSARWRHTQRAVTTALVIGALAIARAIAGAEPADGKAQTCSLEEVSPGPGSTPDSGSSLWGKMLSLSITGLERAIGPPTAWSSINAGVTVDHLAAADEAGNLMLFYSYPGSDWKAVNVSEKTGRTIAVERPESWLFPETANVLERIAAPSPGGDLLLFTWQAGSDWAASNLSASAATQITGPVTSWSVPSGSTHIEHIAARGRNDHLLVFWRRAGGTWSVVDVTTLTNQTIGGAPTSWAYSAGAGEWTERIAAPSTAGDLLLFTFTPSTDWQVANLTAQTGQKVGGPAIDWMDPSGTGVEYLASPAPNGDLVIFYTDRIERVWTVLNVTTVTGQRVGGLATYWVVPAGSAWWEHLAAPGTNGHVYVFHKPTGGTWAVVDVTDATGKTITQSPCSWTSPRGGALVENLAAPAWDGHLHTFSFSPAAQWTTADVSLKAAGRTVYAASEKAGVWKSRDYGMTWAQMTRPQPPQGAATTAALDVPIVHDVAVSSSDPRIVVAGTGPDQRRSSRTGIYRSADGGATWTLVHQMRCGATVQPVTQVIFAPDDAKTLYAAGGCTVAISKDGGSRWNEVTMPGSEIGARVWHVAVSRLLPGDVRRAFACGDGTVWYSHDGGITWHRDSGASQQLPGGVCASTTLGNGDAAQVLAIEPGAPSRVFLAYQNNANGPSYYHPVDGGPDGVHCNTPVVYDSNGDGVYDPGEPRIWGLSAPTGAALAHDARIKYVDDNGNGRWDGNESVVYDLNSDGLYNTIPQLDKKHEPVLSGTEPALGTALKDDPKLTYVDLGTPFGPRGCGQGSLWYGDLSSFDPDHPQALTGQWSQLPGPPVFWLQTGSGAAYVRTHPTTSGYLVFFAEQDTLHVSDGKPTEGSWYRLDGWNPSQNKRQNRLYDVRKVHVDPHGLAISPDFDLRLKTFRDVPSPYNLNRELAGCRAGRIWMSNDGGVYRSDDCGDTWIAAQNGLNTLAAVNIAGIARAGRAPALYFGTGDNDDFHSLDGGSTYRSSMDGCGDCGAWFADPAQLERVLATSRTIDGAFALYESPSGYPDPVSNMITVAAPTEAGAERSSTIQMPGYRPLIQTLAGESSPSHGDYIAIQEYNLPGQAARRRLMRARDPQTWATPWAVEADLPSADVTVVQAAGGHASPTYYAGNGSSLWRGDRDGQTGRVTWTQIVPGGGAGVARKFFVNPYDAAQIYIVDSSALRRSDDNGATWPADSALDGALTDGGAYSYACGVGVLDFDTCVITDMAFDRQSKTRFAAGLAGIFHSVDGTTWFRLVDSRALPSRPVGLYYNPITDPADPMLYMAFLGRGIMRCHPAAPPTPVAAPTESRGSLIINGDFDTGTLEPWTVFGAVEAARERAHSGRGSVRLGSRTDSIAELTQAVSVPAEAGSATLSYWWYIESSDAQPFADGLRVLVRSESDAVTLELLTNSDAQHLWQQSSFSLAAFRGKRVTITFRAEENGKDPTLFYLDDISLGWGPTATR